MSADVFNSHRKNANHRWTFFRAGGFDQVRLDSGADLMALDQLDQKLWVALSCPTQGVEFDEKTLALKDEPTRKIIAQQLTAFEAFIARVKG